MFNVAQCEGLRPGLAADPAPLPEREIVPTAEALIAASGADFRIGGSKAFYVPSHDFIQVPPQPAFYEQINYYRTALHELTHWTGSPKRLARDLSGAFGTEKYAREELAAEMGSAFLCAALGIMPTVRHADYLANWLEVLRGDNRAIFRAASAASKAADYLLSLRDAAAADAVALDALGCGETGGMILLTPDLRFALRANAINHRAAQAGGTPEPDPLPVVKFFNPLGAATWLATELDSDGDTLFGLADLGFRCPELGSFSLSELASVRLPYGLGIERDLGFSTTHRLSVWAAWSRRAGAILWAEALLRRAATQPDDTLDLDGDPDADSEIPPRA